MLVAVGTFNDPRDATLWAGVPITQYPTLGVTVQRANGNPAPSRARVLIGKLQPAGRPRTVRVRAADGTQAPVAP